VLLLLLEELPDPSPPGRTVVFSVVVLVFVDGPGITVVL